MAERSPPTPLFGLLILPFGIVVGYGQVALPYLLALSGLSVARIATVGAIALYPHGIKFLWAPLLDGGARRRSWYLAMVVLTAAFLFAAALAGSQHLTLYTALLFGANTFVATSSSAVDALMATTLPADRKGAAAGWSMAGNLGGTGMGGALAILLSRRYSGLSSGLVLAGLCLAAGSFALLVRERKPERQPVFAPFVAMLRLVILVVRPVVLVTRRAVGLASRRITRRELFDLGGLIISLSPVGAGAALLILPAMAPEYHASEHFVEAVNGLLGGLVAAGGAVVGGYLADRMNRRLCYALAGALTAAAAIAFSLAPLSAATFTWGVLTYTFMNGIAYAAFAAFVLEAVGHEGAVAAKYAVFVAAANQAITYMQVADGWAHDRFHAQGMLRFDAAATFAGCLLLGLMVYVMRAIGARLPEGEPDPAPRAAERRPVSI